MNIEGQRRYRTFLLVLVYFIVIRTVALNNDNFKTINILHRIPLQWG